MKTRVRKLANGRYIAEVLGWMGWKAIWQSGLAGDNGPTQTTYDSSGYRWGMQHSAEKAQKVLNDYLASHGV